MPVTQATDIPRECRHFNYQHPTTRNVDDTLCPGEEGVAVGIE